MEKRGLSRRAFLKRMAVGSAGLAVFATGMPQIQASVAGAQGEARRAQNAEVVIKTAGWPYETLPAEQPAEGYNSYQQALVAWLEKNPNVRLERIELNIWDGAAMLTALAGGTAPTYFVNGPIAGWNTTGYQSVYARNLVADLTDAFAQWGVDAKLSDLTRAGKARYVRGDRVYGLPFEIVPGNGIFYRKDMFKEAGLPEPTPEWTWDDVRTAAKALTQGDVKGIGMQTIGVHWQFTSEGIGQADQLLTAIPAPNEQWHWRQDYVSQAAAFEEVIQRHRGMMFEDQSVFSDMSVGDDVLAQRFYDGGLAMLTNPSLFYTRTTAPFPPALADKLGKPVSEVVGFMTHPRGKNGHWNRESQITVSPLGVDPYADPAAIDAFLNLYSFMELDEGYDMRRKIDYEQTEDVRALFASWPTPRAKQTIDGFDFTPEDAWGEYVQLVEYVASVGGYPEVGLHLSQETGVGPTMDAWNDAQSRFNFEPGDLDIAGILQQAQDTWNQQAAGLASSVSAEDFTAAMGDYYAAHDAYWSANFPDFHENVFKPFYEGVIKPALGM